MRFVIILVAGTLLVGRGSFARAQSEMLTSPPATDATDAVAPPYIESGTAESSQMSAPWYVGADYILWWLREGHVPALLTTGPASSGGRLGAAGTEILYGDDQLETRHGDRFNGLRLHLGYWLDDDQSVAVEASGFVLERDSTHFKAVSTGDQLLARPYQNLLTGLPDSDIVSGPGPAGQLSGGFVGYSRVELFGEQADLRTVLLRSDSAELDLLGGGRFLQMRDRLDLTAVSYLLPSQSTLFSLADYYRTHDAYYGGEVALEGELRRGGWFVKLRADASLGADVQQIQASGDRIYQAPTTRVVQPFGLTVSPQNTGTFQRSVLDTVYETGVDIGFRFNSHVECHVGYTFLYWTNPIRAGDQVDLAGKATLFKEDPFWAQGMNAGVELDW